MSGLIYLIVTKDDNLIISSNRTKEVIDKSNLQLGCFYVKELILKINGHQEERISNGNENDVINESLTNTIKSEGQGI